MNITDHISDLFRTIEADLGTRDLDMIVVQAFEESVLRFEPKNTEDFFHQIENMIETIKATKPKIALIIEHFFAVWQTLGGLSGKDKENLPKCRQAIIRSIRAVEKRVKNDNKELKKNGLMNINDGDTILIHSHSHSVLDILQLAKQKGKKFRVIVAQQEMEKTHTVIEFLDEHKIRFQVVPEYMLSHIECEVNKVFLGALTLSSAYNFVVDSGTMSIVSEFHLAKVPIYVFLTTQKFSMWRSKEVHHTYTVKSKKTHCEKKIDYEHIKFSHDRVPLELFDKVVTEKGIFSNQEVKKIYDERFEERKEWRKKFFEKN